MVKKKFKIITCKNPKCKQPRFMIEKGVFERYCSPECRLEHREDMKNDRRKKK